MSKITNQEILELYNTPGKKEFGFSLLVKKYQKQIYWHVRHMVGVHEDADDLVQDIFLKIWKNLKKFKNQSDLYTWIYRIATNETLTFLKKRSKKYTDPVDEFQNTLKSNNSNGNHFSEEEIEIRLQKAISSLPPQQRTVFELKYYQEMKYEDMAKVLGVTPGSLKASYHFAVTKIKEFVQIELNFNEYN